MDNYTIIRKLQAQRNRISYNVVAVMTHRERNQHLVDIIREIDVLIESIANGKNEDTSDVPF